MEVGPEMFISVCSSVMKGIHLYEKIHIIQNSRDSHSVRIRRFYPEIE